LSYPSREPDLVGPQADPADEFLRLACLTYGADDVVRRANARAIREVFEDGSVTSMFDGAA